MRAVTRRKTRHGGFISHFTIQLLAFLIVSAIYLGLLLPVADRLQPFASRAWWTVVLGPLAVCLSAAAFCCVWRWIGGKQTYALLQAAASGLRLEVLVGLAGVTIPGQSSR